MLRRRNQSARGVGGAGTALLGSPQPPPGARAQADGGCTGIPFPWVAAHEGLQIAQGPEVAWNPHHLGDGHFCWSINKTEDAGRAPPWLLGAQN